MQSYQTSLLMIIIAGTLISGISQAQATPQMSCASHRNAPVYPRGDGQWRVTAQVTSAKTLRNVVTKNMYRKELGSTTARVGIDERLSSVRLFVLEEDRDCGYNLILPRNFFYLRTFNAELQMGCVGRFEAVAVLACSLRD